MDHVRGLACSTCDRDLGGADHPVACPEHPGGPLEFRYNYDGVTIPVQGPTESIWRYRDLLPVPADARPVTLGEGGTAAIDAPALGADLGLDLTLKLEGGNPTGSIKDRGTSVIATYARAAGQGTLACASTGNAGAALAAHAAAAGLDCRVFLPAGTPASKVAAPAAFGAAVYAVEGGFGDAADLCRRASDHHGWWNRSGPAAAWALAGTRTVAYELLGGDGAVPDWLAVPVGNGGVITAIWKGCREAVDLGLTEATPRLLGVQAAAVAPIHAAVTGGEDPAGHTAADGIDVDAPTHRGPAVAAIRESAGTTVAVPDDAIFAARDRLARREGVLAEAASAATVAGLEAAVDAGTIDRGARAVALVTGAGAGDEAATDSAEPRRVAADVPVATLD